jgi:tetratricopeptide (TPR) repeat protein
VTTTAIEREYGFSTAARILGMPESKLRYWSQSGFVGPSLRREGRQVFSFQDLVSARAAKELVERGFQPAHIRKALQQVRTKLPSVDRPLEKLRVAWDGSSLALVEDGVTFEVTGQRRFDFGLSDLAMRAAEVLALSGTLKEPQSSADSSESSENDGAYDWFARGLEKETNPEEAAEAETCYRKALERDPGLASAHTNLGGLAFRRGDIVGARIEFHAALDLDPEQPEARYNLANLYFQQGQIEQAASELRRVVTHSPWFADAHYNLATALEKLGSKHQAAEHLRHYIDLESRKPEPGSPWLSEAQARLRRLGTSI